MIALWRHPHHIIKVYQLRSTANDFNIILAFSHFQHSATPAETVHFNSVKYTQRWQRCSDAVSRVRDIIEVTSTYYSSVPHLLKCIIPQNHAKKMATKNTEPNEFIDGLSWLRCHFCLKQFSRSQPFYLFSCDSISCHQCAKKSTWNLKREKKKTKLYRICWWRFIFSGPSWWRQQNELQSLQKDGWLLCHSWWGSELFFTMLTFAG